MVGAKAGDRVLLTGAGDPALAAEIALITGLNGQTLVVGPAQRREAIEAAAREAGALVELADDIPPAGAEPFDVAVWSGDLADLAIEPRLVLRRLHDALRSGGRIIVADQPVRKGGWFTSHRPTSVDATLQLLTSSGWVAARCLATAGAMTYYEARRPR
jgi:tRNA A58 N-methylase Trm61